MGDRGVDASIRVQKESLHAVQEVVACVIWGCRDLSYLSLVLKKRQVQLPHWTQGRCGNPLSSTHKRTSPSPVGQGVRPKL